MKKLLAVFLALSSVSILFAGGLVTNTNQSAMFTRFQCRDATIDIDAAFYNPAGLVHFSDGFYLSINNQSIGQAKLITSDYENFGAEPKEFVGKVRVPFFPGLYGVYKIGRLAFSGGINPIGGGGVSSFEDGLPSMEMKIADIIPVLRTSMQTVDQTVLNASGTDPLYRNITDYDLDLDIGTSSIYLGFQANVAYMLNDYC